MKTKKSFLWLAFLILATIWILVRHNQQVGYYSVKGLVFGTVYKITYQHDGDLKPEIEAELKRFDQSLSPFNDSSVISRVNRNEELVTDSFFQKCFHRSCLLYTSPHIDTEYNSLKKLSKGERFSVVETIIDEQGNYYDSYEAAPKDAQGANLLIMSD